MVILHIIFCIIVGAYRRVVISRIVNKVQLCVGIMQIHFESRYFTVFGPKRRNTRL